MNCRFCHSEISDKSIVCPRCGSFVAQSVSGNMAAVTVNRAYMYLEDSEFDKAKQCFAAVIAGEPENAKAYAGMLMAELEICKEEELLYASSDFTNNPNYLSAMTYGDDGLKARLGNLAANRDPSKKPAPPKSADTAKRAEPPKPVEPQKPIEPPKPVEPRKPIEPPKPIEPQKPAKPVEIPRHIHIPQTPTEPTAPKPRKEETPAPPTDEVDSAQEERAKLPRALVWSIIGVTVAIVLAIAFFVVARSEVYLKSAEPELGSVEGSGSYWIWEEPQITALPEVGCEFVAWSDGNTDNPRIIDITVPDADYTATFAKKKYSVKVNENVSGGSVTGGGIYEHGEVAVITAEPATGYDFVGWGDGSTSPTRNVLVTKPLEYNAIFKKKVFLVSSAVNSTAMGRVTGTGNYEYGSTATLTAVPNVGYKFVSWSDGTISPEKSFTVTKSISYNAIFKELNFTITAKSNRSDLGTVTGGGSYAYGTTVTLKATSSADAYFVGWSDGITNSTRKITVNSNKTYTANFALMNPTASVGGVEYGSLQSAVNAAKNGDTVTLLKDTTLTSTVRISGKSLNIDGNKHTLNANFTGSVIEFSGGSTSACRLNITDLEIINSAKSGYCIETSGKYADLDLDGCELTHKGGNDGYGTELIRLYAVENGLYLSDCDLLSDDTAIGVYGQSVIEISSDSRVRANICVAFRYDNSDESALSAKRSSFEVYSNYRLGAIVELYAGASDIDAEFVNCEFDVGVTAGYNNVRLVSMTTASGVSPVRNSVKISGVSTELKLISGGSVTNASNSACTVEIVGGTYNNTAFAKYVRPGYTITDNKDGTWTVGTAASAPLTPRP